IWFPTRDIFWLSTDQAALVFRAVPAIPLILAFVVTACASTAFILASALFARTRTWIFMYEFTGPPFLEFHPKWASEYPTRLLPYKHEGYGVNRTLHAFYYRLRGR